MTPNGRAIETLVVDRCTVLMQPISLDYNGASAATGYSADVIRRAVRAGDLIPRYVSVDGKTSTKPVIEYDELLRWVRAGATER
ncbi:hypothetical protein BN12_220032 [Nostocoides japonicum T1-X7]|uniref:Uncharacterized protein n=1 Tax=Nostocoides japonicum T1-X7 TaxID=1194083 RepID=A0A077M0P0_9MICO|nr:hypothetical protein [Tetrasphaera japonica]CCH77754.1 hypothetical protein BN12_220032 [Tetrasphaera japonica T1-X7]